MTFKRLICALLVLLTYASANAQRKFSSYLQTQLTATTYDYTRGNNPWAVGLGIQTYLNTKSNFKLSLDLTGDIYLADDKVLRTNPDGSSADEVSGVVNVFIGASYHPSERVYVAYLSGLSLIDGKPFFGIKPSIGYYFSSSQKWTTRLSFTNIFNRNKQTGDDFGSLSLSVGVKLF